MRKQLLAAVILMGGLSSASYATTQAIGSVLFNFNTTPDNVSYNYTQGYFGYVDGVQAFFDNDYSISHPTFQTNWAYFELEGTQTVLDVAGMITHDFGEPGVVRTWYIGLDVLASGNDSVGAVPLPASLPLLLCALTLLATIRRRPHYQ